MKISLNISLLILAFSVGAKATTINYNLPSELTSGYQKQSNLQQLNSRDSSPFILKAHNVEVSEDVACTFHITPNHNPKVGKSSLAWFSLTRKGGKSIPFSECNCELNVYSQPRAPESKPIMNPDLKGIDTEQYQEIPGAEITFPKAGVYELEIIGSAKDGESFKPFKFNYSVTVTGG
ncbi:MAG: hypothetical protein WBA93_35605 [Microcoleaceae cyanobacterium]